MMARETIDIGRASPSSSSSTVAGRKGAPSGGINGVPIGGGGHLAASVAGDGEDEEQSLLLSKRNSNYPSFLVHQHELHQPQKQQQPQPQPPPPWQQHADSVIKKQRTLLEVYAAHYARMVQILFCYCYLTHHLLFSSLLCSFVCNLTLLLNLTL